MEYKWKLLRPKYAVECPVCHKVYSLFSPLTNECNNCHTHLFEIDYGEVAKPKKKTSNARNARYASPRKQIQAKCHGDVYTLREFAKLIASGLIIADDGVGYFHDGKRETNIDVFSSRVSFAEACKRYPYVCWYNR